MPTKKYKDPDYYQQEEYLCKRRLYAKKKRQQVFDAFKPRTAYERVWCKQYVLPFAEKLIKQYGTVE